MSAIAFLGAGRLARALAWAASRAGYQVVAAYSRNPDGAAALAAESGGRPAPSAAAAAAAAPLVIIAVPDASIAPVAAQVAAEGAWRPGQVVLHTSGALDASVLAPVRGAGASAGSLHPLQTLTPDPEPSAARLQGAHFAAEGDPAAVAAGLVLARAVGGQPWILPPGAKALYHAAAVLSSNYVVALAAAARDLWAAAGIPAEQALPALLPLMQGAVDSLGRQGLPGALTGPIARGDAATVALHLAALAERAPHLLPAYRALGREALKLAPPHPALARLLQPGPEE